MRDEQKYFLDTNIFIYSFDTKDRAKKNKSRTLIKKALQQHLGIISSQVVQEFFNVATKKFEVPMMIDECHDYLETVFAPLCQIFSSIPLYQQALRMYKEMKCSYYDALIIAAALAGGCKILYSEDFQDGRKVGDLLIVNPFK